MSDEVTWVETVKPMVKKLRLASLINQNFTYNPNGCQALAELLEQMASRLDHAVELVGRPDNKDDRRPYEKEI